MTAKPSTRVLSVTDTTSVPMARGVAAGPWIFLPGLLPTAFGNPGRPRSGEPPWLTQANSVWKDAADILRSGASDVSRIVRCDQFFSDHRAVPFFHQARRAACGSYIAPSTSILQPQMLTPGAVMMTDMVAVAGSGPAVEPIFPEGLDLPATSSFVPVAKAGSLVFVAGFLAAHGEGDLGGIAPEAKVPDGHLWKGQRIQLETRYIIRTKLVPALAGIGLTMQDVVNANIYLRDIEDVPAFNQVWAETFAGAPPATTIVPTSTPGFAIEDSRIEINLVASTERGGAQRIHHDAGAFTVCDGHPVAVRCGDLLFFSGLEASDANGLIATARADGAHTPIEAQMEHLIAIAKEVCARAGTDLRNVVRIQQLHTDLDDFVLACRIWARHLPGQPLPISAARVPAPLIVPGCTVQLGLWVYAP